MKFGIITTNGKPSGEKPDGGKPGFGGDGGFGGETPDKPDSAKPGFGGGKPFKPGWLTKWNQKIACMKTCAPICTAAKSECTQCVDLQCASVPWYQKRWCRRQSTSGVCATSCASMTACKQCFATCMSAPTVPEQPELE